MSVVILGGDFVSLDTYESVLSGAGAICFPRVPDPIFFGDGFIQHVTVAPNKVNVLKDFAEKNGMYVLTDRLGAQRQGPLRPNERFII